MTESKEKAISCILILSNYNKTCKAEGNRISLTLDTFPLELQNAQTTKCKHTLEYYNSISNKPNTGIICAISGTECNAYAGNSISGTFILEHKMNQQSVERIKPFDHNTILEFWDLEGKPVDLGVRRWEIAIRIECRIKG